MGASMAEFGQAVADIIIFEFIGALSVGALVFLLYLWRS